MSPPHVIPSPTAKLTVCLTLQRLTLLTTWRQNSWEEAECEVCEQTFGERAAELPHEETKMKSLTHYLKKECFYVLVPSDTELNKYT